MNDLFDLILVVVGLAMVLILTVRAEQAEDSIRALQVENLRLRDQIAGVARAALKKESAR